MPVQVPNIDDEIAYILQYWIQNSVQAITGTIGQNVVWNLAQFIKKNPENWDKATVIADANINYTTTSSECIIIFINNSAGSIDFGNNIWNKWYFVNATDNVRTIAGGKFYYDINGTAKTSIAARSSVQIARGEDDFWYQTNGGSGSGQISKYTCISAPVTVEGSTYTNSQLDGAESLEYLLLNKQIYTVIDGDFSFDDAETITFSDTTLFVGDKIIIPFNKLL